MKWRTLIPLFILFWQAKAGAQTVVGADPALLQAGYIPAGSTLPVANAYYNQFYSNLTKINAQAVQAMTQSVVRTQFNNQVVYLAKDAITKFFKDSKGEGKVKVRDDQDVPYYKTTLHYRNEGEETEVPAVAPSAEEAVLSINEAQAQLQGEEDCPPEERSETAAYRSWEDYLKTIEKTAMSARPSISDKAVKNTLDYLKKNRAALEKKIQNRNYVVINDFTLDSTQKRMLVLNLKTGMVERYLVSHGVGSGAGADARSFSDGAGSLKTPAGFLVMGSEEPSPNYGKRITLEGLEARNKSTADRLIVFHGGDIGQSQTEVYDLLGLSEGCLQVPRADYQRLSRHLQGGVLAYNFTSQDS